MKNRIDIRRKFSVISASAAVALSMLLSTGASGAEAGGKPGWKSCDPHNDKVLYIIGYAHLDTQWRWTYQDSINTFIPNTMHFNFDLIDKYPDYHFNFTGARRYMMMKEYYPKDYERVKDYIAKGRWYISGSSIDENDANVPAPESVIRHVLYGNHYFQKEFGKMSEDYMLPDCFGFTASLPTALVHAGLKGFSTQKLTWGSPVGIPFNVGVWEGPDGSLLPAALNPGSYGSDIRTDLSEDQNWLDRAEATGKKSGFFADFKYYGTGDVGGSPDEESVKWLEKSVNGKGPLCVVPSSSDQMFKELTKEDIGKLPSYKGDLLLKEHSAGSLTSQAYMKRWNRKNELLIDKAERASVIADWLGGAPYQLDRFGKNWSLILGNQMHDILPGTAVPKAYEFSWNDEVIALNNSADMLKDAAGAVARMLDTTGKGKSVIVYNALSVDREDIVQAKLNYEKSVPANVQVFDPQGREVPSQIIEKSGKSLEIAFLAKTPSVGFAVFDVRKSDKPSSMKTGLSIGKNTLENNQYKVTVDENGDVSSVFDKAAGHELLASPARLALLEDSPHDWPAWNIDWDDWNTPPKAYVQGPAEIEIVEKGPARIALEVTRVLGDSTFTQVIRLAAGDAGDRLEFDTSLDWRTRERALKASFQLAASNPLASYNLGMGVIQRPNNNPGKYEVPSRQWLDITDAGGGFGAAVLEDSKFGSDKPADDTLRLTLVRTPKCREYCDQATQDLGRHRILYALAGHKGDWRESGISWRGARLNQPLAAFTGPAHKGTLGKSFSFLKINTRQVMVNALKKAEDSDEIIVRLQELFGTPANGVTVTFPAPIVAAREVNGQEQRIRDAKVVNGALAVDMTGYSPRTFAVKLKSDRNIGVPQSTPLNLSYNFAAATYDSEKSILGFDGKGNSYPAELLPGSLAVDGVAFNLAPSGGQKKNAVQCKGQTIVLPAGKHNRLYILAASSDGDAKGTFKIDGKSVPLTVQEWTGYVGQWDNRIWKTDREIYGLKPAFTKRDSIAWYASHLHNITGENKSYNYSYLFKYRIDLPANAKKVTFPSEPRIKIFAVTAAYNENDQAVPAQRLYDDFSTPAEPIRIEPAAGKFSDSTLVSIGQPWYAGLNEVRYTTDGSAPTIKSPLYKEPLWISNKTTVSARAFGPGGATGPLSKSIYEVNDSTAPRVLGVAAYEGVASMIVKFSEPVEKASAMRMANYRVEPDLGIESVALNQDRTSVTVTTKAGPVLDTKYSLTVENIRDVSPAENAMKSSEKLSFSMTPPVFDLKFQSKDSSISLGVVSSDSIFSIHGRPTIVKGKFGSALHLSADNQCLIVNDRPELNPTAAITVSAWIKAEDWNGNRRILQKGDEDNQYRLFIDNGKLSFNIAGVGAAFAPLPSVAQWHHVAATYDGEIIRLYLDGNQVAQAAGAGAISITADPLYIGAKNTRSVSGDYFKGDMDKITIWNYALSPAHIKRLSQAEGAKK